MITRGIRDFVGRDWERVRDAKDDYWAHRIGQLGPAEGVRIADELRRQAMLQNGRWPDASERRDDLSSHIRVASLLRRACPARRR